MLCYTVLSNVIGDSRQYMTKARVSHISSECLFTTEADDV